MVKEINKRGNPKVSGRICRMMRPKMRRKHVSSKVSELIGTSSDYDLVMEDIEGFLQIVNAHTSGLREFLGIDEGKAEQVN